MIEKKTWEQFRATGLIWLINTTLHVFGWALVLEMEGDKVISCYPARVKFRGFEVGDNDEGYKKVTGYLVENIEELKKEVEE